MTKNCKSTAVQMQSVYRNIAALQKNRSVCKVSSTHFVCWNVQTLAQIYTYKNVHVQGGSAKELQLVADYSCRFPSMRTTNAQTRSHKATHSAKLTNEAQRTSEPATQRPIGLPTHRPKAPLRGRAQPHTHTYVISPHFTSHLNVQRNHFQTARRPHPIPPVHSRLLSELPLPRHSGWGLSATAAAAPLLTQLLPQFRFSCSCCCYCSVCYFAAWVLD